MRSLLRLALLALPLVLAPTMAFCATFTISDFESDPDLAQWEPTGAVVHCPEGWCEETPAVLTRVAQHATEGSYSCQITMQPVDFPGMNLTSFPLTDWSAYDLLVIDVYNPESSALLFHLELSDSIAGSAWDKRYYTERTLVPGSNQIEIDLHNLPRNDSTGDVDTANIGRFLFYADGFSVETAIYADYVRLETIEDDPDVDAARNIYKFDFGTDTSLRWPDFYRVTSSDTYAATPGWGWSGGDSRYDFDLLGPDNLCRDGVRYDVWLSSDSEFDFRLDLPNDSYGVYVIARSGNTHGMPVASWQIWAEGALEVDVPIDPAAFYTEDYYYRGLGDDYPLALSYWEQYVAPNFPAYAFTTIVSDGHLDLRFINTWLYALVVYPIGDAPEMTARLSSWESDRRADFESAYYVNEPESLTFTPTAAETTRGYAVWPVPVLDPCYPDTLPPSPRPALSLSAAAARGERRAVSFALRPLADLTDVSLSVSNLSDGEGHTIPSSAIARKYVRYLATPNSEFFSPVLHWKPDLLQSDLPIEVRAQVTKQLWLDISVPAGQAGGTYTGTVTLQTSAGDLALPLTVEVWAFPLDVADEMSYGWYYMGPDERYCFSSFPSLSGAGDAMLRLDFTDMRQRGFNAIQFPEPTCWPIDWATGWVSGLDMSQLDRYVGAIHDTGFGGLGYDQMGALTIGRQILRHSATSEFDANFDAAYKDVLSRIVDWGGTTGVPLVMYLVDEPRETNLNPWNRDFADTMEYCALASQVSGVVSTVTLMADSNGGVDYTPIVSATDILQTHPWPYSGALIAQAEAEGKPKWFYNTGGDVRMVYGFYQYAHGDGCWNWHFDWLDGDVWDPFPYSPFNNHWHYTYPSPDGPVPTLRYEWASQGISDYRYAATLRRLASEASASGDPDLVAWAAQADALLANLVADVPDYPVDSLEYFAGLTPGDTYLSDLEAELDAYRRQIAELIMQYGGPIETACEVVSSSLPDGLPWSTPAEVTLTMRNLTAEPWLAGAGYDLRAADGAPRWYPVPIPLTEDCAAGESHQFEFMVNSPPLTTLSYPAGFGPFDPAELDGLACNWVLAHSGIPVYGSLFEHEIVVSRFPDILPDTSGTWARTYVEQCAGRVPFIVQGYPDGSYHGDWIVDRSTMAVFVARAADYEIAAPTSPPFPDVAVDFWAAGEIQACVDAGVVEGYPDGLYRPSAVVTRDQMAVYVARACGYPLSPVESPTFSDLPIDHWAAAEIQACFDNHVVQGYPDGFYRPQKQVSRDQMAVFTYRAFIQPTGSVVALGGPALTSVAPAAEVLLPGEASFYGWPWPSSITSADPGTVYVVLDAARLDPDLAGAGTWDVTFTVRDSLNDVVVTHTVSLSAEDITAAHEAVTDSGGCPYLTLAWDLPSLPSMMSYTVEVDSTSGSLTGDRPIEFGIGDAA